MDPQDAIDLGREAMKACLMVGGPILLASLAIGLLVGVLQAMTQVQDQTISFVPKLVCLMLVIGVCLPWLTDKMVDFSRETLSTPMTHFHVDRPVYRASYVHATTRSTRSARSARLNQTDQANKTDQARHSNRQAGVGKTSAESGSLNRVKDATLAPTDRSPFEFPHFRYSRLPSENIGG